MEKVLPSLRGFEVHGVEIKREIGDQANGDCPFCGKEDKFYVNVTNKLWDCKVCELKGNFPQFLRYCAKSYEKELTKKRLDNLCSDRKLPASAFEGYGIGWSPFCDSYTIPIYDFFGKVVDIRLYKLKGRCQATPTVNLGLLGAQNLSGDKDRGGPVYVCEGEWDGFAFGWLLKKLEKPGTVLAVPGASVFKKEWVPWFQDRDVVALYDNDAAGEAGQASLTSKLSGVTKSLKLVKWPHELPSGWDIRDHVCKFALGENRPKWAFKKIMEMLSDTKSGESTSSTSKPTEGSVVSSQKIIPATREEAFDVYRKWLHLLNDEALQVMFGAAIANKMQGDPLWLFLVAPPGGSKSELLSSLSRSPLVESTTSLTPHSLVSGAHNFNGQDPSLLPKLNGRILVIKDFTTILSMHYSSRDEIFGVLRDAYDGRTEKTFGTGLKRTYVSHFGIIAGVTPKIEEFGTVHQSLGERFLKYRINTGQKTLSEADRIRRALSNINQENQMHDELAKIGTRVLEIPLPAILPIRTPEIEENIVNLAQVCAMMRGVVERNPYNQTVVYKPAIEVGTRLAKQLCKLALGIAIYRRERVIGEEIYRIVCKVALDTAPDRVEEVIKRLQTLCRKPSDAVRTNEVSIRSHLPQATCFRILQDLELLRLVNRVGSGNKYEWKLNKKLTVLLKGAKLYEHRSGHSL